MPIKMMMDNLF